MPSDTVELAPVVTVEDISTDVDEDAACISADTAPGCDPAAQAGNVAAGDDALGEVEAPACCYVCEEETALPAFSVCSCTDRLLHLECQAQLMRMTHSHRLGCPVCRCPYNNVQLEVASSKLSREGKRLVAYIGGIFIIIGICVYEGIMWSIMLQPAFLAVSAIFAFLAIAFMVAGWVGT